VLEHIDNDFKALQEIQRILRPGGLAHIEVPADPPSFDLYDEVLMHFRRYRLGDLTTKAREAGFAILKATHLGFFVYPLFKMGKRRNQKAGKNVSFDEKKASWHGKSGRRLAINSCRWRSKSSEFSVAILRHPSGAQTSEDLMR
jgi:SAM-dependent methyltransferase